MAESLTFQWQLNVFQKLSCTNVTTMNYNFFIRIANKLNDLMITLIKLLLLVFYFTINIPYRSSCIKTSNSPILCGSHYFRTKKVTVCFWCISNRGQIWKWQKYWFGTLHASNRTTIKRYDNAHARGKKRYESRYGMVTNSDPTV